jgi:hypothetical protein
MSQRVWWRTDERYEHITNLSSGCLKTAPLSSTVRRRKYFFDFEYFSWICILIQDSFFPCQGGKPMEINIVETDQQLQQILWTCYDYWCKEDLPPNKRSICYSWISRSYADRFDSKFHPSKLSQLAKLGFLKKLGKSRSGHRRYYAITSPNNLCTLLKKWELL